MTSITRMSQMMSHLFVHDAAELAHQVGMRERSIPFFKLAVLLVLGWWREPHAGPSALARFGGTLGLRIEKQVVDCHFTERTACWLLALLRRAVLLVVTATPSTLPLLRQFNGVLIEDGSSISLPASLASLWRGCGGKASAAALKLTARWNLLTGQLEGPHLQAGASHELASVLRQGDLPKGCLWLADVGYWSLLWLSTLCRQGVYFLMRYKAGLTLWLDGTRLSLLESLPEVQGQRVEMRVDIGAARQVRGVRLLAERVPESVAKQRRERHLREAAEHGQAPSPQVLALCPWTIVLCNVPAHMLNIEQAFLLLRVRWQIELLFKLWKQDGLLDECSSQKPWRILCELYAKLLAVLIHHWLLILSCWEDPHHSLHGVAAVLREQVTTLAHGLVGHFPLRKVLAVILDSVGGGCSIPDRSTRPSTSHLVFQALPDGLT